MKKYFIIILLFTWFYSFSQQENTSDNVLLKKNELKLGLIKLSIYNTVIETEYEHLLNRYTSIGGNFVFLLENKALLLYDIYSDVFVRFYFTNEKYGMSGLFAQPFLSYLYRDIKEDFKRNNKSINNDAYYSAGLGFGFGYKLMIDSEFGIQSYLGLGHNFNNNNSVYRGYVPRIEIHIGWRF